jgi:hypothetical protein
MNMDGAEFAVRILTLGVLQGVVLDCIDEWESRVSQLQHLCKIVQVSPP